MKKFDPKFITVRCGVSTGILFVLETYGSNPPSGPDVSVREVFVVELYGRKL